MAELIGIKATKSHLGLTKAKIVPNHIFLLTNPLINQKIKVENETFDGKFNGIRIENTSNSYITFDDKIKEKNKKRYENKIKELDIGYLIPINIDENLNKLKSIKDNNCYKITNQNNRNYFIYQLINNEVYVLVSVINNYFINHKKQDQIDLFNNINDSLKYISINFTDAIKILAKINSQNTYAIYGGCIFMQGHYNYPIPTEFEKFRQAANYIEEYKQENNYDFIFIKKNYKNIFNNFIENKKLNEQIDIKETHFQNAVRSEIIFNFFNYYNIILFPLIIKLEYHISKLIMNSFPELFLDFNIKIPTINSKLLFFKSFGINFSIGSDSLNQVRQGAVDLHKDSNDCLYAYCVIVVFGTFKGGDIKLPEIGIVMQIDSGYIILLRSALLSHMNSLVLGNRYSMVFYLNKYLYNEV